MSSSMPPAAAWMPERMSERMQVACNAMLSALVESSMAPEDLRRIGVKASPSLSPKSVSSLLYDLSYFGAVVRLYRPDRIRLTTLGCWWAVETGRLLSPGRGNLKSGASEPPEPNGLGVAVKPVGYCPRCGRDGITSSRGNHARGCHPPRLYPADERMPAWLRYHVRLRWSQVDRSGDLLSGIKWAIALERLRAMYVRDGR